MFYLIKEEFGRKICLEKNTNDVFQNGIFVDCSNDISKPSNIQKVRDISMNCNNALDGNPRHAMVFTDAITAKRMNLL